ncbi:hypothetical protein MUP59_05770 [Candidatus Bathyarchaeota archaeon]|nr:hypothetical protein [Candidatus Bathyarchaeota archaeon]
MAYASDARIKKDLKEIGSQGKLKLRVFDESHEDHRQWKDNGLRFGLYGASDGAWYLDETWTDPISGEVCDKKPVIVVEGSFGTERGNIGSAQYARFHHALGAVIRGLVGVYFIPTRSSYYRDNVEHKAAWRLDLVYGCLGASELHAPGEYLMIDAYDPGLLKNLVSTYATDDVQSQQSLIKGIKDEMKTYADEAYFKTFKTSDPTAAFSRHSRNYAYNKSRIGKILKHNVKAFTDARYRNGHIIVGEALLLRYWAKKQVDLILPRFTNEDCIMLDHREQKEWKLLRSRKDIRIITFDDLIFKDRSLEKGLIAIRAKLPLLGDELVKMNSIIRKMKDDFGNGLVGIRDGVNTEAKDSKDTLERFL